MLGGMRNSGKVLIAIMLATTAPALAADKPVLVERVGNTGFVQVEAESFNRLTSREKELT